MRAGEVGAGEEGEGGEQVEEEHGAALHQPQLQLHQRLVDASASRRGTPGEEAGFNKIVTIEITGHGKFQFLTESFT